MTCRSLPNQKFDTRGQHLALARNRVGQDHVERGQAVGLHDQQMLRVHRVDVAHLAAVQQRQALDAGLEYVSIHNLFRLLQNSVSELN